MKSNKNYFLFILILSLILISGCKKDNNGTDGDDPRIPVLSTNEVTDITQVSAVSGGVITEDGGSTVTVRGVCWSTNETPTINDNKTEDGAGAGAFTSHLEDLTPATNYYVRAYAANINGTGYGMTMSFKTFEAIDGQPCPETPNVSDIDGNVYNTVQIGNQCWMKENLKTTKYHNGTAIEYPGTDINAWEINTTGAYAWYDNDISYKSSYGALYNWHAVNNANGLCPEGWHVPSDNEWEKLVDYVVEQGFPNERDSINGASNALRSCRQANSPLGGECNASQHPFWYISNTHFGFDEFGFSALPGGYRGSTNQFYADIGITSYWWSSSEHSSLTAWMRFVLLTHGNIYRYGPGAAKGIGLNVRCIKD